MNTREDIPCSAYCQGLDETSKVRYLEKISVLEFDPYLTDIDGTILPNHEWPTVEYPDVFNYLVTTPSKYTKENLKSLEGYKLFVDGWITKTNAVCTTVSNSGQIFTCSHGPYETLMEHMSLGSKTLVLRAILVSSQ